MFVGYDSAGCVRFSFFLTLESFRNKSILILGKVKGLPLIYEFLDFQSWFAVASITFQNLDSNILILCVVKLAGNLVVALKTQEVGKLLRREALLEVKFLYFILRAVRGEKLYIVSLKANCARCSSLNNILSGNSEISMIESYSTVPSREGKWWLLLFLSMRFQVRTRSFFQRVRNLRQTLIEFQHK